MSRTYHHHHRQMRWNGPSWWTHMFGNAPIRRKSNQTLKNAKDLNEVMMPHQKKNKRGYFY